MSGIRIKKGDLVKVIAGKDKGKEGKVVAIDHKKNTVIVEGAKYAHKAYKTKRTEPAGRYCDRRRPDPYFQRDVCS